MKKENQALMTHLVEKDLARALLKENRSSLSEARRGEARETLLTSLFPLLKSFQHVLSFHSFGTEVDTSLLNTELANEKRLLLPKVVENSLLAYAVTDLQRLLLAPYRKLKEPDPDHCLQVALEKIECVLVPGLGFDSHKRRIGYGKGHYDRLLFYLKSVDFPPLTIGIGFKEQFFEGTLPYERHDLALDQIFLV